MLSPPLEAICNNCIRPRAGIISGGGGGSYLGGLDIIVEDKVALVSDARFIFQQWAMQFCRWASSLGYSERH